MTNQINTAQLVVTAGQILALERRSNMTDDEALRFGRSVETALLSKLRAPVADELPEWKQISAKLGRGETLSPLELFIHENEPAGDDADAWRDQLDAALASAPVARPKRAPADDWRVTAIAECLEAEWDEMTPDLAEANARIIVGYLIDYEKESALIEAKRASAPVAGEADDEEATDAWRRLALQFDGHRMQALCHLRAMLADPQAHAERAAEFLAAPPLSGEQVLADRIRALAAPQASEAVRDALMAFDEAMRLCDDFPELQHHRDALLFAVQKARAALSAQPGAQKEQSDA
ncbi:hypothetical protein [Achromobacter insolitus]|uniref:hypothetical protein n=1 Tax=Achromobacter insolitus TaxID=217204 RepID=UPI00053893AA|nr:hypothetical protein [Achromobacter insolitus]AVG38504.1 hypothetical protein MC81_03520 [Achromobacter insolitus]